MRADTYHDGTTVAIFAPLVGGAMGQYLEQLEQNVSELVDLHLFVPERYASEDGNCSTLHRFKTGATKWRRALTFLNPFHGIRISRELHRTAPDVIHIFNGEGYPWSLIVTFLAKRRGIPVFITVHDPEVHPGRLLDRLEAVMRIWALKHCRSVHVHSKTFIPMIARYGIAQSSIEVIPHGNISSRFTTHGSDTNKSTRPTVLFFGRFEKYKGIDVLVAAAELLPADFQVVIAGHGTLSEKSLKTIERNPNRFELLDRFHSDEEVALLFRRAWVFVMPYVQASQSSLPLISATFGVPVVGTSVGALAEDIPAVGGVLVAPGSDIELAQGIITAIGKTPVVPDGFDFKAIAKRFYLAYRRAGGGDTP